MILIVAFPKQICKNRESDWAVLQGYFARTKSTFHDEVNGAVRQYGAVTQTDENLIVLFIANLNHGDQIFSFFFKQCSSFCWLLLLGPHTYLTSNITLERLRPHKFKWTDVMTLTGIFIQRMFPEIQLWSGGQLIDLSHISLHKLKAPPPLHVTLPQPQGSKQVLLLVRLPSARERTPQFPPWCQPGAASQARGLNSMS